jgi:hypothetical protein
MKLLKEAEIRQFISDEKLRAFYNANMEDNVLNEGFARFSFLRQSVDLIPSDKSRIYYSMYFWFVQFKKRYAALMGPDAGIEQQGFQLLEEIDQELEDSIDWGIIEAIENDE